MRYFNRVLKRVILLPLFLLPSFLLNGQETPPSTVKNPPIFVELFAGNRALAYQVTINKKFQSAPKFGFFGATNLQPEWGNSVIEDYMLQGKLTYSVVKGVDLAGGFIWNPVDGIRPSAAATFSYATPKVVAIFNPRVDIAKDPNFELFSMLEYKPKLSNKLTLYTRAQGIYTHNFGYGDHSRSYIMVRAGISYKDFTFGAATNFDWYGPTKIYKNNFGGFVAVNLF